MSANRIFLVCQHHPQPEHALLIAERAPQTPIYEASEISDKARAKWFEKHALCGQPDDFQIAYGFTRNHDIVSVNAEPVKKGVKLALVNGSGDKHE